MRLSEFEYSMMNVTNVYTLTETCVCLLKTTPCARRDGGVLLDGARRGCAGDG